MVAKYYNLDLTRNLVAKVLDVFLLHGAWISIIEEVS
jgi:hypothetical protein